MRVEYSAVSCLKGIVTVHGGILYIACMHVFACVFLYIRTYMQAGSENVWYIAIITNVAICMCMTSCTVILCTYTAPPR